MRNLYICIAIALLATVPVMAQDMTIEVPSGAKSLKACDNVHAITGEDKCTIFHVGLPPKITGMQSLQVIRLDDNDYVVNWMGPGFYLEGGLVIQAMGDAESINGQQWLEVAPQNGRTYTSSSWNDVDGNGALSLSDSIVIDGKTLQVKDVRLQARVSPLLR